MMVNRYFCEAALFVATALGGAISLLGLTPEAALAHSFSQIDDYGYVRSETEAERIEREFKENRSDAEWEWRQARPPERSEGPGILADHCQKRERYIRNMDRLIFEAEGVLPQQKIDDMRALTAQQRTEERSRPCPVVGPPEPMTRTAVIRNDVPVAEKAKPERSRVSIGPGYTVTSESGMTYYMDGFCLSGGSALQPEPAPAPPISTLPANPTRQGLTQEEVDEVARQQRHFDDLARARQDEERERAARQCPQVEIQIGGYYLSMDKGIITGTGVLIDPGNERFIEASDRNARGRGIEFRATYYASPDDALFFGGRFGRSTDRNATSIAPGTTPVGSVYHDRAPNFSTGVALGATGADAVLARDSEYDWFGAGYERRLGGGDGGRPQVKARVMIEFEQIRDDFDLEFRSTIFPTISMDALQQVRQTNLGLGAGITVGSPPGATGLVWEGSFGAEIYRADTDLDSVQRNLCGLCGVAERDFTITIRQEDKRWGWGTEAALALGYRFKGEFELGVQGRGEYGSDHAGVENPETGNDLFLLNKRTGLFFDDSLRWTVGVYGKFQF